MKVSEYGPDDAPVVLLLHGGGVAGWMWDSLQKVLEEKYKVIVPDLPGHGASSKSPYLSHDQTVAELQKVLAERGSNAVAVIGFSLGAQLAIALAAAEPGLVGKVMLISAQAKPMRFTKFTIGLLGLAAPLARKPWFARLQAKELFIPTELLDTYILTSAAISKETLLNAVTANMQFELPARWTTFQGKAVVLVGEREKKIMHDSAALLHARLPGSEIEIVEGCGHGIPFQRAEWFNTRVADWLNA